MYIGDKTHVDEINFFDSEKFVSFPFLVDSKTAGVVDGILPAGSIIPANDKTAKAVTIMRLTYRMVLKWSVVL